MLMAQALTVSLKDLCDGSLVPSMAGREVVGAFGGGTWSRWSGSCGSDALQSEVTPYGCTLLYKAISLPVSLSCCDVAKEAIFRTGIGGAPWSWTLPSCEFKKKKKFLHKIPSLGYFVIEIK